MTEGAWGQKRVPECWRRAQSACAAVSCARWVRKVVEVWKEVMVEAGRASVRKRWERARLLAAGGEAGGRRGCQTHENERFSCSFFLQGEETSNRRLSKRAGHLDMVRPQAEIAWALLPRVLLPRSAGPSGCRKFPQFRQIR